VSLLYGALPAAVWLITAGASQVFALVIVGSISIVLFSAFHAAEVLSSSDARGDDPLAQPYPDHVAIVRPPALDMGSLAG